MTCRDKKKWQQDLLPQSVYYMSSHNQDEALSQMIAVFVC